MRIAFVCYSLSSFIKQDFDILSRHYHLEKVIYQAPSDIIKIAASIWRSDISFSWFASGHSFIAVLLSKILQKKSIVVAGGYDVAFAPEIDYGQYTQGWLKRKYADFALKYADLILAVSEFTKDEAISHVQPKRIEVVYNAIDIDRFKPAGEREDIVLTVASGQKNTIKLKGLDVFVKAASYLPDIQFLILGVSEDYINSLESLRCSNNVRLCGHTGQEELITYYQKAKVYCQLSYRESFGVALAEAMACGCVPVVTERGALPEVVGDTGFYVPYGDEKATADGIKKALKSGNGSIASERIRRIFSLNKREIALIEAIEDMRSHPC